MEDKKTLFKYLDGVLKQHEVSMYNMQPLVCESYELWTMFGPSQDVDAPLRLGFFGDIQLASKISKVFLSEFIGMGDNVLFTRWRGRLMQELMYRYSQFPQNDKAVIIHENCLFDSLVICTPVVDVFGLGGIVAKYGHPSLAHRKPVFQFTGHYFNLQ